MGADGASNIPDGLDGNVLIAGVLGGLVAKFGPTFEIDAHGDSQSAIRLGLADGGTTGQFAVGIGRNDAAPSGGDGGLTGIAIDKLAAVCAEIVAFA